MYEQQSEEHLGPKLMEPRLSDYEQKQAEKRSAVRAAVVHEAIQQEGEEELLRPVSALAWSGLAAGLSMGFSLVTEGLLRSSLPEAQWAPLISKFGYSIGFVIVILGRQQLFTENTLTPILPLLVRRNLSTLWRVARLWAVVLLANLVGSSLFAWVITHTQLFGPRIHTAFSAIGVEATSGDFWTILVKAVFAGWLIALMVWLLPGAETARVSIIGIITYVVGVAGFCHIVAGSVEAFYVANTGAISWAYAVFGYLVPTLIGNIIGGVALVAALNYAQVAADAKAQQDRESEDRAEGKDGKDGRDRRKGM